jgi:branched-chain amino acid transport system substrate-binding protein
VKNRAVMALATAGLSLTLAGGAAFAAGGAAAHSPYVIGVPLPETGSSAAMGTDMWHAIQLAAKTVNAHGGVMGHPLKLIEEDSACDPQASVNAANLLVSLKVQAIVGTYCSGEALPAEPIYHRAGLPFVLPSANASSLTEQGFNDVFMVNANGQDQAHTAAAFFTHVLHAKRIALIDDQSAYATNLVQLTEQALKADHGNVVDVEAVPPTQQDFSALINKLKAEKVDLFYWTGYYAQGGLLIKQARQLGYKGIITVGDGSVDQILISTAGAKNAEGVYATMTPMPPFLKGPKAEAFYTAFEKAYHTQPGPYSALTYDALMTLVTAAEQAHSLAPAKVIQALHKVHYMGITGPIAFTPTGNRVNGKFLVLIIHDGHFELAPRQP